MTSIYQGPGSTSDDLVVTTVDEEIRQEALRQIESIDYDDDNWRIEPLPTFSDPNSDAGASEPAEAMPGFETAEEANRHSN